MSEKKQKAWIKSAFTQMNTSTSNATPVKKARLPSQQLNESSKSSCSATGINLAAVQEQKKQDSSKMPPTTLPSAANWMQTFAPKKIDELAVHTKKLNELQDWLRCCDALRQSKPAQICLLSGPSGAGKTAALKLLAENSGYELSEWINPVDKEALTTLGDHWSGAGGINYNSSQTDIFKTFLWRASRYHSLLSVQRNSKSLLLVEDFPNALLNDAAAFHAILEDYQNYGKTPLAFVVTELKGKALNISYNLFPDEVKLRFGIKHISFNPIATTLMNKAMKLFCALMSQPDLATYYKVPSACVVDSIVCSAQGDIRNALLNLHFAALKEAGDLPTKMLSTATPKGKPAKKQQRELKSVGRDESITMMHVLGRIFNPKYTEAQRFLHSPETLVEATATEPKKIVNFIHANFAEHFADIEQLVYAADGLSIADMLLSDYRGDSLNGLNVAIRNCMVANTAPVAGWKPVRAPKWLQQHKPEPQVLQKYALPANLASSVYALEYSPYLKHITTTTTN